MAIALRTNGTGNYYVASPAGPTTVSKPAAVQAGDVAIIVGSSYSYPWVAPSGWTAIISNITVYSMYASAWYRVIQAGDSNWNFSTSSLGSYVSLIFIAFTGVNTPIPLDVTGTASTSSSSDTVVANSITIVNDGAWWMNAVAKIQTDAQPQFSAPGFSLYDNSALTAGTGWTVGLLWNGPMSPGATGSSTITATKATGTVQHLIALPFALAAFPPTVINTAAVSASSMSGPVNEHRVMQSTAPGAIGTVDIGFSDRLIEGGGVRRLENNSVRLLEFKFSGVAAVTAIMNPPATLATGLAGVGSAFMPATTVTITAVNAVGFIPATSITDLIGAGAIAAAGNIAAIQAKELIDSGAVMAVGYSALISTADIIGTVAVASDGFVGTGSLTLGGGVYLNAIAVEVDGYAGSAGTKDMIGVVTVTATARTGVIVMAVAGSVSVVVDAVLATCLTGTEVIDMAIAPSVPSATGVVPPVTGSFGTTASIPSIAASTGNLVSKVITNQPPPWAGVFSGLMTVTDSIFVTTVSTNVLTGLASGYLISVQTAVGCTPLAGNTTEAVVVNQSAVNSTWYPSGIQVIKVFNVTASAVGADAFPGTSWVVIAIDAPAVIVTGWTSTAIAIPNPPLGGGPGIAIKMPVDEFGCPYVVTSTATDEFGGPHLTSETGK